MSNRAIAALLKNDGEDKAKLEIKNAPVKLRARNENSEPGGGTVEAVGAIGNVDVKIEGGLVDMAAGRPEDDETRTNMICLFKDEILKDKLPYNKICDLVDELQGLGVYSKDMLKELTAKDIEGLKTLPSLQKRILTKYIAEDCECG